jgi:hypothetical protein
MFKVKTGILLGGKVVTGSGPSEVLTIGDVGSMAFQNTESFTVTSISATSLFLDDTASAYNLELKSTSNTALTANRILTIDVNNVDRTLDLGGNITTAGAITTANAFVTSGNFSLTLTTTAATNVTLPTTGTLAVVNGNIGTASATSIATTSLLADNLYITANTADTQTILNIRPSGTSTSSRIQIYDKNDVGNSAVLNIVNDATNIRLSASINGTGTQKALGIYIGTAARLMFNTNGSWGIGASGVTGNSGQALVSNGAAAEPTWQDVKSRTWVTKTVANSGMTAVDKDALIIDTSGGAFTLNLPTTPSAGTTVTIIDAAGTFGTYNLTINPGASCRIMGAALDEDMIVDVSNSAFELIYSGTAAYGWRIL